MVGLLDNTVMGDIWDNYWRRKEPQNEDGTYGSSTNFSNRTPLKRGQTERPVISGYTINGWDPGEFLGFHKVQIDAYTALLAALNQHIPDLELVPTGDSGDPKVIKTIKVNRAVAEGGVMHHAHVKKRKWDTAGVDIAACCEAAKLVEA